MTHKTYSMDEIMRFSEWSGSNVVYVPAIRAEDMERAMDSRDPIVVVMEDLSCICGERVEKPKKPMPDNTPEEKSWEKRYKEMMGTLPRITDEMRNSTCLVCGHPFDKSLEYLKLKDFIAQEIASAKADIRREEADKRVKGEQRMYELGRKEFRDELLGKIKEDWKYGNEFTKKEITDLISNI